MKLLLLSGLHLELSGPGAVAGLDFDVALLASDIVNPGRRLAAWVAASPVLRRARAVVAVSGNHEYFDAELQREAAAMHAAAAEAGDPPLYLLDGAQVVIDSVRFLGCTLWTGFAAHRRAARRAVRRERMARAQQMADYRTIGWLDDGASRPRPLTPHDTLRLHRQQRDWLERALAEPFAGPTWC